MNEAVVILPRRPNNLGVDAIALFEVIKGVLAVFAASGLELLGPASLRRGLDALVQLFHVDPQQGAIATLSSALNPDSVHLAAAIAFVYGLMRLIEGWGLWRGKAWASWLGCISAAIYLPLDLYALFRHRGGLSLAVLTINLWVVWVLGRDLFKRRQ